MPGRMKPIDPAELSKTIVIEQLTEGSGTSGLPTESWTNLVGGDGGVMAKKEDLRGNERFQASQLSSPFDTRWLIWYREDMDPDVLDVPKTRRIVYQNRRYDIVAAQNVEITQIRQAIVIDTLASGRVES